MKFVDLNADYAHHKPEIDAAMARVIADGAYVRGRHVRQFESDFAALVGARFCVSCASGSDALYIALKALGLKAGDEVLTPAFSWIATAAAVTQAGGKPVFCDIERDSFTIDPAEIEARITSRTRGIIAVHLYGQSADMDRVMEIARRHDLWVIEDCAQAPLARFSGKPVGGFGDIATYSFYPTKNLGALGDAGSLTTQRADIAEFARAFADHGGKNQHVLEGVNSRMDGVQAAILSAKIPKLRAFNARRRRIAQGYDDRLGGLEGVQIPARRPHAEHVYHLYVVKSAARAPLQAALAAAGVPTAVQYPKPLPLYPAYRRFGHRPQDFPAACEAAARVVSLPLHPYLEESDVNRVAGVVLGHLKGRSHAESAA
ncbi:MAG: DegT/DnrJ/EryC1/StrS family aminotransferase [Pseudomonadota bacterium]